LFMITSGGRPCADLFEKDKRRLKRPSNQKLPKNTELIMLN